MGFIELFLIAIGLSMDAFAVAICTGLTLKPAALKESLIVGLYFGLFQAAMPLIGFFAGSRFSVYVQQIDHWIAFVLLAAIGSKMIAESLKNDDQFVGFQSASAVLAPRAMLPLAVATSIDAFAVGISFAFLQVDIIPAVLFIGVTTLILSAIGVFIGNAFGEKLKAKAEVLGGIILILIGLKILIEHLYLL